MQAPRFLSLFIHWEQMFFSVSMWEVFSLSEDKDAVAQVSFYKKINKRERKGNAFSCLHSIYAPYKYHIENTVLTQMVRNIVNIFSDMFF